VGEEAKLRANGLDVFDDGRIICSDVGNQRVLIIDTDGNIQKEFKSSETFRAHFPNGVQIVDQNSFVHTNPIVGEIIVSNLEGEQLLQFGGMGTNIGVFGRAVGVAVSEDGMYWITDAMGSTIQAFNKEGEVKLAISTNYFSEPELQIAGPRGIMVQNGMLYVMSERSHKLLAFSYQIIDLEK
jgi:sugar lactone lactonase YvrE